MPKEAAEWSERRLEREGRRTSSAGCEHVPLHLPSHHQSLYTHTVSHVSLTSTAFSATLQFFVLCEVRESERRSGGRACTTYANPLTPHTVKATSARRQRQQRSSAHLIDASRLAATIPALQAYMWVSPLSPSISSCFALFRQKPPQREGGAAAFKLRQHSRAHRLPRQRIRM